MAIKTLLYWLSFVLFTTNHCFAEDSEKHTNSSQESSSSAQSSTSSPKLQQSSSSSAQVSQPAPAWKTRLRASRPHGTFRTSSYTRLERIEVDVKNVGSSTAENVRVTARTPSGSSHKLKGSTSLPAHSEETYHITLSEIVTSSKKIKVNATCDNCYK